MLLPFIIGRFFRFSNYGRNNGINNKTIYAATTNWGDAELIQNRIKRCANVVSVDIGFNRNNGILNNDYSLCTLPEEVRPSVDTKLSVTLISSDYSSITETYCTIGSDGNVKIGYGVPITGKTLAFIHGAYII